MGISEKETKTVSAELAIAEGRVANTISLLEEGGTIPFIARYRKEMTGSLDEVQILAIRDSLNNLRELNKRKAAILDSLAERDLLEGDLRQKIEAAATLANLEDIYLPYRPKKRTRATAAREKGLEPLAHLIVSGGPYRENAAGFLSEEHEIETIEDALAGARDLVTEWISENIEVRRHLRKLFAEEAVVSSRVVEKKREEAIKFRDYFDWSEPAGRSAGHRLHALFRGESQRLLRLVKIDPKSIGVGQYQHDVNQAHLKKSLEEVVIRCVNRVGVELNSASAELLSYVAGLGPVLAANIVAHRKEQGAFGSRRELLKVKRLGAKAYEQCAGFLRVRSSANPLDNSGVHPERYALVQKMADDLGAEVKDLLLLKSVRSRIRLQAYCNDGVGMETLNDIMAELAGPGRDPRQEFIEFRFDDSVHAMEDLQVDMILPAIITNITKFGAFADIGIKQDGLIHISRMADRYIKDPSEVVSIRQQVRVRVIEVDIPRKRIGLSLLL